MKSMKYANIQSLWLMGKSFEGSTVRIIVIFDVFINKFSKIFTSGLNSEKP